MILFIGNNINIVYKDIVNIVKKDIYIPIIPLIIFAAIVYLTGQYSYIESLDNYKTNTTTVIISSYPVITLILAYLYFNETITYIQLLGILLIFTGIIMICC
jgi:drug/metabolite transporter (DMT)-like permease